MDEFTATLLRENHVKVWAALHGVQPPYITLHVEAEPIPFVVEVNGAIVFDGRDA